MNTDYLKYLFYLTLIMLFFSFLFILKKKRQKPVSKHEKINPITAGNISMFFDDKENAVTIAYVTDLFGVGKATGNIEYLNIPYNDEQLGASIRAAMSLCIKGTPCSDTELMNRLGFRSWVEFSKGKRNISVHFREGFGVIFNSTIRKADGAYQFNYKNNEKVVSPDASNIELGKSAREVLQRCRS